MTNDQIRKRRLQRKTLDQRQAEKEQLKASIEKKQEERREAIIEKNKKTRIKAPKRKVDSATDQADSVVAEKDSTGDLSTSQ